MMRAGGDPYRRWPNRDVAVLGCGWPVGDRFAGAAVPDRVAAATVSTARRVPASTWPGPSGWLLGQCVGGWVIH